MNVDCAKFQKSLIVEQFQGNYLHVFDSRTATGSKVSGLVFIAHAQPFFDEGRLVRLVAV